jgi:hypothetical protein
MKLTRKLLMGAKIENLLRLAKAGLFKGLNKMRKKQLVSLLLWRLSRKEKVEKGSTNRYT